MLFFQIIHQLKFDFLVSIVSSFNEFIQIGNWIAIEC